MRLHKLLRRSNQVRRYHTEPVIRDETVGHHCANVCAILIDLYQPEMPSHALLYAGLTHDTGEYYTGDIPAPAKKENQRFASAYRSMEEGWLRRENVPKGCLTEDEYGALKFADSFDCVLKFMEEAWCMGNSAMLGPLENALVYCNLAFSLMNHEHQLRADPWLRELLEHPARERE